MPQNCLNVECASAVDLNATMRFHVRLLWVQFSLGHSAFNSPDGYLTYICSRIAQYKCPSVEQSASPDLSGVVTFTSTADKVDDLSLLTLHTRHSRNPIYRTKELDFLPFMIVLIKFFRFFMSSTQCLF